MNKPGDEISRCSGPRIMGGMFGLPVELDASGTLPPFASDRAVYMANGRCCLVLLIELLSPARVWLPSYLCPSIIAAVRKTGVPFCFYENDYNLRVLPEALAGVLQGDLVVVIDYFGFPAEERVMHQVRETGAWLLEDACQAMLTDGIGKNADFTLFTPRKFVGIPDGGILVSNRKDIGFEDITLEPPPSPWWMKALSAAVLRREFDLFGGSRLWFELYQELEEGMPMGPYAMSDLSKTLMNTAFDYASIARRRVENYQVLAGELSHLALYPSLASGVVPLGFPVRLANRNEVLKKLYGQDLYPPVHWRFRGLVPAEFVKSYRLLDDIMMLPCDQRYGREDMLRMAGLVRPAALPAMTNGGRRKSDRREGEHAGAVHRLEGA
jgi:hypothetical protein